MGGVGEEGVDAAQPVLRRRRAAALCYGWIDGQARRLDDDYYLLGFTPRRRRSPWSRSNVDRVAVLAEQGLIRPPGQAEIDRAKADGRWAAALEQ